MAQPQDTTPAPPHPHWDEDGALLLCSRRRWTGVVCRQPLLVLRPLRDPWGQTWRVLYFLHNAWEERNGVWRETHNARHRRRMGQPAKPRTTPYKAPAREGGPLGTRGPVHYPTAVLCPERDCGHKRILEATMLDVVPEWDVFRYAMYRTMAPDEPASWPRPGHMPPLDVHNILHV